MSSISEKHSEGYHCNNWGVRIGAMEVELQTGNPFPNENCFNDSIWWIWEDRVKNAHNQEEKQIQNRWQEWKDQIGYSDDPSFDPDGWAGDEYWETCRVTNSMYAALVVAMWSKIESFLKSMVSICSDALGKHNEILETVKKFCEDSLQREKPNVTLDHCIKALNKMKEDIVKKKFMAAHKVAKEIGCTSEHISTLIKKGEVEGKQIGAKWFITKRAYDKLMTT